MDANLANSLVADSAHAVLGGTNSSKPTAKLAQGEAGLVCGVGSQGSASQTLARDGSAPTFQQALDQTLSAAVAEPDATPRTTRPKTRASTQAQPLDGSNTGLASGVARPRKAAPGARPADAPTGTEAPGNTAKTARGRRSTGQGGPADGPAEATNSPKGTDRKDPATDGQQGVESANGTDLAAQIAQPTTCAGQPGAVMVGTVEVQDSPKPTAATEPVADRNPKASRTGKTVLAPGQAPIQSGVQGAPVATAEDPGVPSEGSLRQAFQPQSTSKAEQRPSPMTISGMERTGPGPQPGLGRPEDQGPASSKVVQRPVQTPSEPELGSTASATGEGRRGTTQAHRQTDGSANAAPNLAPDASVQSSKGQGEALESGSFPQASNGEDVSEGRIQGKHLHVTADRQGLPGPSLEAAQERTEARRASGASGSATTDGRSEGQGLSAESLPDLSGSISERVAGSSLQTPVEGDRPSVQEQVLSSIRGAVETQTHRLSVELNPPELGKVVIRFEQHEGSLSGLLEVDNRTTRAEIEQALPQIIQNLQDSGIQVKRLDVVLNDQHPQPSRDGSSAGMYQGHQGQRDPGHPWPYMDQAVYPDAALATPRGSPEPPGPQVFTGGGSINLLV